MSIGEKVRSSNIDKLLFLNMSVHRFVTRTYTMEIDFNRILDIVEKHNVSKTDAKKIRISAVLMKAIASACDYTNEDGRKPFRRLSGYFSCLPWGGAWKSRSIDISLMIVRELDNNKEQTVNVRFKSVNDCSVMNLSEQIWQVKTMPENQIPQLRFLKRIARLPGIILYLVLQLTKFVRIRSLVMAPTSVSILKDVPNWFQGEHISMFTLGRIDSVTRRGVIQWTIDHRLGMGLHFGPFTAHLKGILESPEFLERDLECELNGY